MQGTDGSTQNHDIDQIQKRDWFKSYSITADYTFLDNDKIKMLFVTTAAATITVTLPTAADNIDRVIEVMKIDAGAGKITIDGEGAETINGSATYDILSQYESVTLKCNGTTWFIVAISIDTSGENADICIEAGSFQYPTSDPAPYEETTLTNIRVGEQKFDASTVESVLFAFDIPDDITAPANVTFLAKVRAVTADGNEIQLRFSHAAIADDEDIDSLSYTDEDSGDFVTSATQNDIDYVEWTETWTNLGWAAGDRVYCKFSRIAIAGGTPLGSDLALQSFTIKMRD